MYAEGTRSDDAKVGRLRSGAAVLAARHRAPIVPVYVGGTSEAMPKGHHWMVFKAGRPGPRHRSTSASERPFARRGSLGGDGAHPAVPGRVRGADTKAPQAVERQPA